MSTRLLVDQAVTTSTAQQLRAAAASATSQTSRDVDFGSFDVESAWETTAALRQHRAAALEQLSTATADTLVQGVMELLAADRAMAEGL